MGGKIRLDSTLGQGTTVSFMLVVDVASAPAAVVGSTPTTLMLSAARVLVVEDHPYNQSLLRQQLGTLGVDTTLADCGAAALSILQQESFDLVLMDCHMPGMDGYETTRRIRSSDTAAASVPVIAISAATDADHLHKCEESGMDGVLRKPVRISDLSGILDLWSIAHRAPAASQPSFVEPPVDDLLAWIHADAAELQRALRCRDLVRVRHWVHRIHGVAMMAGYAALADAAGAMEASAMAGEYPDEQLLGAFNVQINAIASA
jgi:two-component system sensor histidine kinase EvgS